MIYARNASPLVPYDRKRTLGGMLHLVLFAPQIPQNTGNIGRLCALTRSRLHLIHPLGFKITDRHLRRAGMDYWKSLDVHEHADWAAFRASLVAPPRLWLFTTKAQQTFWEARFTDGDGLVFGNEGEGAPAWLHEELRETRVTIPHANPDLRSLNLSTAAGIACYE
ncbi:MAG TPA: tRNA (cytidine(34)-2'-O)-methyltransferase, partial [Opitutaceae bacterium]|nr:tRNA (cytidine(34)-2'-O)-methyltransferase [Opitutaceae bacterium]